MITVTDWQAPQPSFMPSHLDEETQLESLQRHLESLVKELQQHKTYQEALNRLVSSSYVPGGEFAFGAQFVCH